MQKAYSFLLGLTIGVNEGCMGLVFKVAQRALSNVGDKTADDCRHAGKDQRRIEQKERSESATNNNNRETWEE